MFFLSSIVWRLLLHACRQFLFGEESRASIIYSRIHLHSDNRHSNLFLYVLFMYRFLIKLTKIEVAARVAARVARHFIGMCYNFAAEFKPSCSSHRNPEPAFHKPLWYVVCFLLTFHHSLPDLHCQPPLVYMSFEPVVSLISRFLSLRCRLTWVWFPGCAGQCRACLLSSLFTLLFITCFIFYFELCVTIKLSFVFGKPA